MERGANVYLSETSKVTDTTKDRKDDFWGYPVAFTMPNAEFVND